MISCLSLGSNLGDRVLELSRALEFLESAGRLTRVSSVYRTAPVGMYSPGGFFLNMAVRFASQLSPFDLLHEIKAYEKRRGRSLRNSHRQPRIIDIDILLAQSMVIDDSELQVPHPLMHERAFVLAPLVEIAPRQRHPLLGKTVARLWRELSAEFGGGGVVRVGRLDDPDLKDNM